jgi:hypothetical protein
MQDKHEDPKRQLENLLVEFVVMTRDAFVRSVKGKVPMSYWDQIQNRIRSAARTNATASEFVTSVSRKMKLGAPSSSDCLVVTRFVQFCDENGFNLTAMEFIDREIGFIIAMARQIIDARKKERETTSLSREAIEEAARENGLLVEE